MNMDITATTTTTTFIAPSTSSDVTPQRAADLYNSGLSVIEVARACGTSYSRIRRLLKDNGTPIRDASARLKGKTRPDKKKPASSAV